MAPIITKLPLTSDDCLIMNISIGFFHFIKFHNPQIKIGGVALSLKPYACIPNNIDQVILGDIGHTFDVHCQISVIFP